MMNTPDTATGTPPSAATGTPPDVAAGAAATPSTTRALQRAFTAHIRDPAGVSPPAGIERRRMKIYNDLIYNNIERFIAGGFPVLRRLYRDEDWHRLVRGFVANHRCHTPYFIEISQEFLRYLMESYRPLPADPPFLLELAHYEWVELALGVAPEEFPADLDGSGDPLGEVPVLSPLVWSLRYSYPVHKIGPRNQPAAPSPEPTFLVVYRNRGDDVRFLESNSATARLLELLRDNVQEDMQEDGRQGSPEGHEQRQGEAPSTTTPLPSESDALAFSAVGGPAHPRHQTGQQLLERLAREMNAESVTSVVDFGARMLHTFLQLEVLAGCRLAPRDH